MLKKATIAAPLHTTTGGNNEEETVETVPPGHCWVMEGKAWITLIWARDGTRRTAELPIRRYDALLSSGCIRFDARNAA